MALSPEMSRMRSRVGSTARRSRAHPNAPELLEQHREAKREFRFARFKEHMTKTLATDPPFTPAQLTELAALLDTEVTGDTR